MGALLRAWCQVRATFRSPEGDYLSPCPDGSLTSARSGPDHRVAMMSTRPSRLRGRGTTVRWWAVLGVALLGLVVTGCQTPIEGTGDGREPLTLVVSDTWVRSHQAGGEAAARIGALRDAVERLRSDTHTGWVGRQDDVTGFLAELSGGSWPGSPAAFIDEHGPALFGVDSTTLLLGEPDTETVPNVTTTRATQALSAVPVLDASLVITGRGSPREHRLTARHRRPWPGLRGTDRRHHAHDQPRAGDDHRRRGVRWDDRRHRTAGRDADRHRGAGVGGRGRRCDTGGHAGRPLLHRRAHR